MNLRVISSGLLAIVVSGVPTSAPAWTAAGDRLKTRFAGDVVPDRPLPGCPRPQLMRDQWNNFNGIWSYAVTSAAAVEPENFAEQILVPFPVESSLSGVGQSVERNSVLWYRRTFSTPALKDGERLLLNFGAVNWETEVYINGHLVGSHRGAYDPFSFDISFTMSAIPAPMPGCDAIICGGTSDRRDPPKTSPIFSAIRRLKSRTWS